MAKDSFDEGFKRLVITPEVCAMLGKTENQIRKMDMRQFADCLFEHGYDFSIAARPAESIDKGKLTITTDRPLQQTPGA